MSENIGKIEAVCMSPKHGYPTYPQERVIVGPQGIEGDAHSGPMRESFRNPGTLKPNDRPISIVSDEVRQELNERGYNIQPGGFNEQVLVSNMDLSDVPIGTEVHFGTGVKLKVTDIAFPCTKLEEYNGPGLMEALTDKQGDRTVSRRGILAEVLEPGVLEPGVEVTLIRPATQPSES